VLAQIAANEWNDDIKAALDEALSHFKQTFLSEDAGIVINEEEAEAMAEGVETQEKVRRIRRAPVQR